MIPLFTLLTFLFLLPTESIYINKTLAFREDHTFTIMQLTDMHFGENYDADQLTKAFQKKLIRAVKPDLVVVSGDAVSDYGWNQQTPDFYYNCWTQWTEAFTETETRYAYILGNHDYNADLNGDQIIALDQTNPYSLTQSSTDIHGYTNYILPIHSSFSSKVPSAHLWMFDTHNQGCEDLEHGWSCIHYDQIDWYKAKSEQLYQANGKHSYGLGFYHIPLPEYKKLLTDGLFYGNALEFPSPPLLNTGFFDAMKKTGNIHAGFCGHDHHNDYGGHIDNIELVYGRKSGHGGYSGMVKAGARIIQLKEYVDSQGKIQVKHDHWIVDENLEIENNKIVTGVKFNLDISLYDPYATNPFQT
jgi:hypothetical protein